MTEIIVSLPDEDAIRLREEAEQKNTTPETIAAQILVAALASEMAPPSVMSESQFQESLERTMAENLELLKRLA